MSNFYNETYRDSFNLLCGKKIGEGIHRVVFECRLLPHLVVKVEKDDDVFRYFANPLEMQLWCDYAGVKSISKWLAPCEFLSPDGRVMLQRKADPVPSYYKLPKKIPAFLTDIKRENFGIIDERLVCLDYTSLISTPDTKLQPANWD